MAAASFSIEAGRVAPAEGSWPMWSLKIVEGVELADKPVAEVRLPTPLTRFGIGRDPANAWAIADRTLALSARHCEIVGTPQGPLLRDLSTNGTFVNGSTVRLAAEHPLRDGDRVQIGPFLIAVTGPAIAAPAPAASMPAPLVADPRPVAAAPRPASASRGGDPAAMLAGNVAAPRVGLTEILRAAPAVQDSGLDLTRIRAVPSAAAGATPAPVHAPPPAPPAPRSEVLAALARGLGVPPEALADAEAPVVAERVARVARAALEALWQRQPQEARAEPVPQSADLQAALLALLRQPDAAAGLAELLHPPAGRP